MLRSLLGQAEPPPIPDRNDSRAASTQEAQELGLVPGLDPVAATPAMGLDQLERAGFDKIDYFTVRDAETLAPAAGASRPARVLAAAWLGKARLIDNVAV